MKKLIEIINLKKDYYVGEVTVHALKGVDMIVNEGEFVAIMGASGSGKSTMLNIIGCLDKPTNGEYILDGTSISHLSRNELSALRNRKLGFVFQTYNLLPRTNALDNVELPLMYNNTIKTKERKERAQAALESVGLADRMYHKPNQLSGGQQQRVAIARSLVNDPVVILADEATGNLDTRTSYEIMALFQELNNKGKTIVFVTHELDIARCATRNIIFKDGLIQRESVVKDRINCTWRCLPAFRLRKNSLNKINMSLRNLFKIAMNALLRNKFRAFLTMLGIIIGVASVIAMLGIGQGSKLSIQQQISGMGLNLVSVVPGSQQRGGIQFGASTMQSLKESDVDAILSNCPAILAATPEVRGNGQVVYGACNWPTSLYGENESYLQIRERLLPRDECLLRGKFQALPRYVCLVKRL